MIVQHSLHNFKFAIDSRDNMIKKLHYLITDLILSIKYFNKIDKKNTQNTFFLFQMKKKKKFHHLYYRNCQSTIFPICWSLSWSNYAAPLSKNKSIENVMGHFAKFHG